MATQMKAIEQCFPVVLFIILCKVVLVFEFVDEILKCSREHCNEFSATDKYFRVVLNVCFNHFLQV